MNGLVTRPHLACVLLTFAFDHLLTAGLAVGCGGVKSQVHSLWFDQVENDFSGRAAKWSLRWLRYARALPPRTPSP